MKIILGSSSKPRKAIMQAQGYQFEVMTPDIDEKAFRDPDIYKVSLAVARAKAEALLPRISEPALLITADNVIICDKEVREKPESEKEARRFLDSYSKGSPAEVLGALVVCNTLTKKMFDEIVITKVFFGQIPSEVIDRYVASRSPFSHAGGFEIEHDIIKPYITNIEGEIEAVRGLSIVALTKLLAQARASK